MDRIGRRDPARVIAIGGLLGLCLAAGSLTLHRISGSFNESRSAMASGDGHGMDGHLPADPWGTAPVPARPLLAAGASDMMAMAGMAPPSPGRDVGGSIPKLADAQILTCDRVPCETIPSHWP